MDNKLLKALIANLLLVALGVLGLSHARRPVEEEGVETAATGIFGNIKPHGPPNDYHNSACSKVALWFVSWLELHYLLRHHLSP